jgi:hypothetical protein
MSTPPIPLRAVQRPTAGGLVVPYISLEHGGRHHLGRTRGIRVAECFVDCLCQICGQKITGRPILFLGTQTMIDEGFTGEPPVHPECGAYSAQACPMVAGRMGTYAKNPYDPTGTQCDEPGCSCGGWTTSDSRTAGQPSEPWFQIWVSDYAIAIRDANEPINVGNVTGAHFAGRIVKTRPIQPGRADRSHDAPPAGAPGE